MTTVTLSTGRPLDLREPTAGELRGIKLLDVLQLDAGAHAALVERLSDLSAVEFYALKAPDAMAVMAGIVGFFAPNPADQSDSQAA
ncbi:MAG: phage tail assembly protein [Thiobacillaceae bacterium]|jgi:hypothetical protein|nr:phage tail assembly protein [Thiobacillaceae bacterium]